MPTSVALVTAVWDHDEDDLFGLLVMDYAFARQLLEQMELLDEMCSRDERLRRLSFAPESEHLPRFGRHEDEWDNLLHPDPIGGKKDQPPPSHLAFYQAMEELRVGSDVVLLPDANLPPFIEERFACGVCQVESDQLRWKAHEVAGSIGTPWISREMLTSIAIRLAPGAREKADAFRRLKGTSLKSAANLLADDALDLASALKADDLTDLLEADIEQVRVAALSALAGVRSDREIERL